MRIHVEGRHALNGTWRPSGNPNAALALLAAALLGDQPVTLHNMPRTASTLRLVELVNWLGADTSFTNDSSLRVKARQLSRRTLTREVLDNAGAILLLAPLLWRCGHVRLESDMPRSRLLTHLDALRDLGQDLVFLHGAVEVRAVPWERREILLDSASVTATGMVLMLAACLGGETTIHNAASEPHVQELCRLLEAMGGVAPASPAPASASAPTILRRRASPPSPPCVAAASAYLESVMKTCAWWRGSMNSWVSPWTWTRGRPLFRDIKN